MSLVPLKTHVSNILLLLVDLRSACIQLRDVLKAEIVKDAPDLSTLHLYTLFLINFDNV